MTGRRDSLVVSGVSGGAGTAGATAGRTPTQNARARTRTRTHPFNGPLFGTTQVSQYQKGKTNLDFTGARDSEWQWHQLGHMQVCISLQTDNHASTPPLSFFTGRMPFLPPNQQCQSTEGTSERTSNQIKFKSATCRAVGPTQFTPPPRQDGSVCVASGVPV